MKLSVIIPVYNEDRTILTVIDRVLNCGVKPIEVIVVNDCSTDGTSERLNTLDPSRELVILNHEHNRGKGASIRTGLKRTTGDVVVIQDADLEYNPKEFRRMIDVMERFKADAVFGSRYSGSETLVDSWFHYYGNKLLTSVSNLFCNLHLTDMETCYKMIRGNVVQELKLECNRFGIEPEITAKLAKRKSRICEVPITYEARRLDEGKKIGWRDGVAAFWYILKYNLLKR